MLHHRNFGLGLLTVALWAGVSSAQPLSAINGDAAVRAALDAGRSQGWEVLYSGQDGGPHGPDLVFQDPAKRIFFWDSKNAVVHVFEVKANNTPLRVYHGHLQGTPGYAVASAKYALGRRGLSAEQRVACQLVLEAASKPGKLKCYVVRTPVAQGQAVGRTTINEVVKQTANNAVVEQLSKPRDYKFAGKVVARGIVLLVMAKDVRDGVLGAIEIERLYDEGQFDEFTRDLQQVRNASQTGGRVAGTLAGLWFGAKAGAALGALAGSVAGPVGSVVAGTLGSVIVGVACYMGGEAVFVGVADLVSEKEPGLVRSVVGKVRATYNWVETQVTWMWDGSWAQQGYQWTSSQAGWLWEASWAQSSYRRARRSVAWP